MNPEAQILSLLQALLSKKYQLILGYIHFGDQLRSIARDGLYKHFQEHLKEERSSAYDLNKKITAMGGDGQPVHAPIPGVPLEDVAGVLHLLLMLETESVQLWSTLANSTEDVALNGFAQDGAVLSQAHVDDMKRYLRSFS